MSFPLLISRGFIYQKALMSNKNIWLSNICRDLSVCNYVYTVLLGYIVSVSVKLFSAMCIQALSGICLDVCNGGVKVVGRWINNLRFERILHSNRNETENVTEIKELLETAFFKKLFYKYFYQRYFYFLMVNKVRQRLWPLFKVSNFY